MISVAEAQQIIQDNLKGRIIETVPVANAFRYILATDIISPMDLPPFDNSAMDGYAFRFADLDVTPLEVIHAIAAGDDTDEVVTPGEAVRIYTGAKMPPGVDTVVMQEHVQLNGNTISILNTELKKGSNVRLKGSQIQQGEVALYKNTILNPAAIGFIASMGIKNVEVFRKPKIQIIVTGNELLQAGDMLQDGKIYESNAVMLQAALHDIGLQADAVHFIHDKQTTLIQLLEKTHADCDAIIITGGVSVGDHDIVSQSKSNTYFTTFFHKVKQKPGKPFLFGQYRNVTVFCLPGNPASVLTCFYVYVVQWLQNFYGNAKNKNALLQFPLISTYRKKPGMTHFLKGRITPEGVEILLQQESYILRSLANADCLIIMEEDKTEYNPGDEVYVMPLPHCAI